MARIVMPVAEGFEDSELTVPMQRLREGGHEVTLLGSEAGVKVRGKRGEASVEIDETADHVLPEDFDLLVIPGGHSPDRLRVDPRIVDFVRRFFESGRPVAAICHGPQLLIEADVVRGKTLTSWPSVRRDLENAGATWIDRELVEDENLITSRKPGDLDVFCQALESQI
ncbi:MAG: type 1 glutamine amidotransferase domain-containing protein [bacterium]